MRMLLKADEFAFAIPGGAHDLRDNIARLSGGDCEYVVVTTATYRRFGVDKGETSAASRLRIRVGA